MKPKHAGSNPVGRAEGGRNLIYADLINSVPATSPLIIFDINNDMDAMEVAIQQAY